MHPSVVVFGHTFLCYDLAVYASVPVGGLFLYFSISTLPVNRLQLAVWVLLGDVVQAYGGRVLAILNAWLQNRQFDWWASLTSPSSPGRYFHSVFLTYLLFLLLGCLIFRWPVKKVLDRFIVGFLLASTVGRVGCLLQGCCGGRVIGTIFKDNIIFPMHLAGPRYPTQAIMIVTEALLSAFLWYRLRRNKIDGEVFWTGVFLYSIYRFLIEILRDNPVFKFGLTHAQCFSIATFVLSACVLAGTRMALSKKNGT